MEQYDDKNCYWSFPQGIYKFYPKKIPEMFF